MNILITGITGFIGEHISKTLLDNGDNVFAVVRLSSNRDFIENNNIPYHMFDGNCASLRKFINSNHISGVIHLASVYLSEHTESDLQKIIEANILFGVQVLESSLQSEVKWFINTGSFWQHYLNDEYNPVNFYAASKQAFQSMAEYYMQAHNLNFVTLQLCDTYGPGDKRKKIIELWANSQQSNQSLGMSPGEQMIDMCYIDDVVNAFIILKELLSHDDNKTFKGKVFGVSANERLSLRDLASVFESVSNKKLMINWGDKPYRKREVMTPWSSSIPVPGWSPTVTIREGLRKYLEINKI